MRHLLNIRSVRVSSACASLLVLCAGAMGQATQRTIFVANNGNLEGAVTGFTIDAQNRPVFVSKTVIGTTPSTANPVGGTNADGISITPDGKFLATSHTTALTTEQITVLQVNSDSTTSIVGTFLTPDSPLDLAWLNDDTLAVTRTRTVGTNEIIVYRYDRSANTMTEIDREPAGTFCTELLVDAPRNRLFSNSTTEGTMRVWSINCDGTITNLQTQFIGPYFFGISITSDGLHFYSGVGTSNGGNVVTHLLVDPTTAAVTGADPAYTPSGGGASAFTTISTDDRFVFVGHNTGSEVYSLLRDPATGLLTNTGNFVDIGDQGGIGNIRTYPGHLVVTRDSSFSSSTPRGIRIFAIGEQGQLTPTSDFVSSGATAPNNMVIWSPRSNVVGCNPADIADDQGTPLPGSPNVPNAGVNEGDYNAFFSANGFFHQATLGLCGVGKFCDIADDQGTPKPPFGNPVGANTGVNEGDYNCFFNNLFLPC